MEHEDGITVFKAVSGTVIDWIFDHPSLLFAHT